MNQCTKLLDRNYLYNIIATIIVALLQNDAFENRNMQLIKKTIEFKTNCLSRNFTHIK